MHDVTEVTRAVRQVLESYRRAGLTHLAKPLRAQQLRAEQGLVGRLLDSAAESGHTHRSSSQTAADASRTQQPGPVSASIETLPDRASKREAPPKPAPMLLDSIDDEAAPLGPKLSPQEKADALNVLQAEVSGCTRCSELASTRTQTVFGVGDPCARLVFIGEAPGGDEDRLGEPFVGRAGQLLTDIITKAMKLRRQDVYILNVLKCRPPGHRNQLPRLFRPATGDHSTGVYLLFGFDCGQNTLGHRRFDRPPAQEASRLSRHPGALHVPSGLPAAQPGG
jgi:DNA polymerase